MEPPDQLLSGSEHMEPLPPSSVCDRQGRMAGTLIRGLCASALGPQQQGSTPPLLPTAVGSPVSELPRTCPPGKLRLFLALAGQCQSLVVLQLHNFIFDSTQHPKQISCQRPKRRLVKSGHGPLPESFSNQPLPFGILCLEVCLLQSPQGLLRKERLVPLCVFSGEAAEDLSGAPQAAREG